MGWVKQIYECVVCHMRRRGEFVILTDTSLVRQSFLTVSYTFSSDLLVVENFSLYIYIF